ncbi:MAG: glycosyltransferase family 4 protein [Solirubrobacterales bacterium]|nr:glycosyltransferase family 4 protein [Solirubrobacterales bacterium]MBV9715072.1 glycosyltransferase family 4 protein [Solirubrobacterales bacterium]
MKGSAGRPLRCVVAPPAPAPYREPLFRALHDRSDLELRVIYQSGRQPSWDVAAEWFAAEHAYPARHLPSWQRGRPGRTPIIWPRGLERALRSADPDCVVASEYGPASLRALWWCRRHGRAYVVFTECTPEIDAMLPAAQLRLHRWVARHADGVVAVSSAARARLLRFGVPAERITVALQSADLAAVRAASAGRDARRGGGPVVVLSVGRMVPDKNFSVLIEAFARAGVGAAEARLEIAGGGFLAPELGRLAERLAVAVRFHGHVAPAELPRLYAAADLYALVSTYEPFGVSLREAAAAGLPIICSRAAGAAGEVAIDGRNAVLVDPGNVEEVSAALTRLIGDGRLRRAMGAESRAIDTATDGHDVDAFAAAVLAAARRRGWPYRPRSTGRTSRRIRSTRAGRR